MKAIFNFFDKSFSFEKSVVIIRRIFEKLGGNIALKDALSMLWDENIKINIAIIIHVHTHVQ